jgi:hypothetical protein
VHVGVVDFRVELVVSEHCMGCNPYIDGLFIHGGMGMNIIII